MMITSYIAALYWARSATERETFPVVKASNHRIGKKPTSVKSTTESPEGEPNIFHGRRYKIVLSLRLMRFLTVRPGTAYRHLFMLL